MHIPHKLMALDIVVRASPIVAIFFKNMTLFLAISVEMDRLYDRRMVPQLEDGDIFDFIIVGSGSSGSALANRLSQDFRVLLLEAGGYPSPILSIPILSYMMSNQSPVDWKYRTVPQTHAAFGLNNNISYWGSGKGLGGSSLINGLIYIRGNTQGFDIMANKTEDPRWALKNILKHYKHMEDYHGIFDDGNSHGKGGEVSIEKTHLVVFIDNLMRAGKEIGYLNRDPNAYGPLTEGFAPMDFYLKSGMRHDAFTGSVMPVMKRSNLVIRKFALVTDVLLHKNNAYGVRYERHGKILEAHARKEVILSGGAIRSAQLLMLAGIGPKEHLQELGIPVLVDLPVGKRLEDKFGALVGPFTVDEGKSFKVERDLTTSTIFQWLYAGRGLLAAGRSEATHHIISDYAKRGGHMDVPDIHTYVVAISPTEMSLVALQGAMNFNNKSISYFRSTKGRDAFFQLVTLSRPFGFGNLTLANRDPHSHPIIDPKYLQDPRDVKTLVAGLKFATGLVENTSAFKEINGKLVDTHFPGCENEIFKSDSYFECLARHTTLTAYKYSATAPIGKDSSDPDAVVDSQLRVFGTTGLRVVDASVLQVSLISVNDITCRMLGDFAAEMIIDFWKAKMVLDDTNRVT